MIYCYPKLSERDFYYFRLFGPGLGNLLFPWAKALVYARQNNIPLISPAWPQVKLGPLLRREKDTRLYSGYFSRNMDSPFGVQRLFLLLLAQRSESNMGSKRGVIEFSGMDGYFSEVLDDYALVKAELFSIVQPQHKKGLNFDFSNSITLHVRLGDFAVAENASQLASGKVNLRIPLSWYAKVVESIRNTIGADLPIYIFSDGTDSELSELLSLANCQRLDFGSAIADMLALSQSNILVASGSTFSMWASFLGRMPVVWYPGQLRQKLYTSNEAIECESADGENFASCLASKGAYGVRS